MYLLNAGWPILFAHTVQQVYDFNIIALRLAEHRCGCQWWLRMTGFYKPPETALPAV